VGQDGRINNAVSTSPSRIISEIPKLIENPGVCRIGSTRYREPGRNGAVVKRRPDLPAGQPVKPADAERRTSKQRNRPRHCPFAIVPVKGGGTVACRQSGSVRRGL
jgi:hypothetical protein